MKKPLVVIIGPTASGKSKTAVEICKMINGEVVTADSMQIYKYMNIGTAKPTEGEMMGIRHHMLDVVLPSTNYSLADYVFAAEKCIDDILSRGKIPVLTGGTGLYVDTLVKNIKLGEFESDEKYKKELEDIAEKNGNKYLYEMLKEVDPESAEKIHFNNVKRVIRALEFFKLSGIKQSLHNKNSTPPESKYNYAMFLLELPREILYEHINQRVDKMMADGLLNEVKMLQNMNIGREYTSMQGIGYKELLMYLNGEISYEKAVDMIKQNTRRYAKRQQTWFKREEKAVIINPNDENKYEIFKKTMELCGII